MNRPRVSVLMSVCNGARHLGPALESIRTQTFHDFEFLAINDGSTDATGAILSAAACVDPRLRVIEQLNAGLTVSLNRGLRLAQGVYIARMDGDDLAHPDRLQRQVAFLDSHPAVVAVGSQATLIDDRGRVIGPLVVPTDHDAIDGAHIAGDAGRIVHPTVLLRGGALRAVGGYRTDYDTAQDYDLWLRLAEVGRLANLPEDLLGFRQHLRSVSTRRREQQGRDLLEAWRDARRRRCLEPGIELPQSQRNWLSAGPDDTREWWVSQALTHGHLRTAWFHTLALLLRFPARRRSWRLVQRAMRTWLRSTSVGAATLRALRGS